MISPEYIIKIIKELTETNMKVSEDTALVGSNSMIDSMSLVQLCIELEQKASDLGFVFDWTSDKAMSSMNSVFKSPNTLAAEFNRQFKSSS